MPNTFRYTKEHPYIGKGLNRLVKEGKEYINEEGDLMEFNDLFMRNKMGLDIDEFIPANITVARKNYLDLLDNGEIKMVGNTLKRGLLRGVSSESDPGSICLLLWHFARSSV